MSGKPTFEIKGPFDEYAAPFGKTTMTWQRTYVKHLPSGIIVTVDRFPEKTSPKGIRLAHSVVIHQPGIFGDYYDHETAIRCAKRTCKNLALGLKYTVGRRWRSGISHFIRTGA